MVKKIAGALVAVAPLASFAALPTGVSDAVSAAGTDGNTLLGVMAAAAAGLFLIKKVLAKFGISF